MSTLLSRAQQAPGPGTQEGSSVIDLRSGGRSWTVVHDFAYVLAGAERVSTVLANRVVPGARLLTLSGRATVLDEMGIDGGWDSLLPAKLLTERSYRLLTPLYPHLLRALPPVEGDVIASSYAFAHHVRCTGRKIVYCHTPLRQVWSGHDGYLGASGPVRRLALRSATDHLRRQDLRAAAGAATYVAASTAVSARIARYYGRDDVPVVTPPIDTRVFTPAAGPTDRSAFLWVGRIVEPYKRLEMTIEAFRGSRHRLVVAGDGAERARLEALAPPNVTFLGWRQGEELADLYRNSIAVVFPSEDDFGLVPVESNACGTPAVAFAGGGAQETVVDGLSGLFFAEQTPASLAAALDRAARADWNHDAIVAASAPFGADGFVQRMREVVGV